MDITYWSDGYWCYTENLETYKAARGLSDNYTTFTVPEDASHNMIQSAVEYRNLTRN